jgi:hypothetical protein
MVQEKSSLIPQYGHRLRIDMVRRLSPSISPGTSGASRAVCTVPHIDETNETWTNEVGDASMQGCSSIMRLLLR